MKTIIIYASIHHKNTEKVAKAMGEVLNAKLFNVFEVNQKTILDADCIGFGSGIYFFKFHRNLIKIVTDLPPVEDKKAFVFSTAGIKSNVFLNRGNKHFKKILKQKNFKILGDFECLGLDTNGILKKIGGINKGRPNEKDLEKAKKFASEILP